MGGYARSVARNVQSGDARMDRSILEFLIVAVVAVAAILTRARISWGSSPARYTTSANDNSLARLDERIARLEQAVDAIAIETERIGESQRFLTRILAERQTGAASSSGV